MSLFYLLGKKSVFPPPNKNKICSIRESQINIFLWRAMHFSCRQKNRDVCPNKIRFIFSLLIYRQYRPLFDQKEAWSQRWDPYGGHHR